MMDGMAMPPLVKRGQHEHAQDQSQPVVGFHAPEKRPVTAIMEHDEASHHKAGGRNGKEQCQPVTHLEAAIHQVPPHKKWNDRIEHLP